MACTGKGTPEACRDFNALALALAHSQPPVVIASGAALDPAGRAAWMQWRADVLRVSQAMGHLITAAGSTQGDFLRACCSPD